MFKSFMNHIKSIFGAAEMASEEGQGTIEYILILGVIVVGIFTAVSMTGLGTQIGLALDAVVGLFGITFV